MPPRPPAAQATAFATSIEQSLDRYGKSHFRLNALHPRGGSTAPSNANAIRDILGMEVDAATASSAG